MTYASAECECCSEAATHVLLIEQSEFREISVLVCKKHHSLAVRRKFDQLFADWDRKVDRVNAMPVQRNNFTQAKGRL